MTALLRWLCYRIFQIGAQEATRQGYRVPRARPTAKQINQRRSEQERMGHPERPYPSGEPLGGG